MVIRCFTKPDLSRPNNLAVVKISLQNQSFFAYGQVSYRGQVIEIKIPGARSVDFLLDTSQFLVLHFQFYLVHPKFVDQSSSILDGQFIKTGIATCPELFPRPVPGCVFSCRLGSLCRPSPILSFVSTILIKALCSRIITSDTSLSRRHGICPAFFINQNRCG